MEEEERWMFGLVCFVGELSSLSSLLLAFHDES
jgi:hypothetical protein